MPKSQTKILYLITQSDSGGAQKYVYDLSANFSQKYNIIVASGESAFNRRDKQGYKSEMAQKLDDRGIKYKYIPHLKRAILPWRDFLAFWQIVKLIKSEKPNIIHLNSSKISILGSLAARWCKTPKVIYTVHGWVFNEELPAWKKAFYKTLEKFTAKFKNQIICLSEFDKQTAIKQKIVPAEKISVIYNGIAPIKFLPRDEARKKLKIHDGTILVGTIANLYKTKGLNYLIEAMNQVSGTRRQVLIIGDGPEKNNLESSNDKITLAGNIPNAASLLSAFDIYVCSSIKEGLPYTILEAMKAGLPIISTDVGAIPEIITDGKNGLLVEPKKPEQLVEKIKYLIDNTDIAKKLGEQAKKDVAEKFSLERMLKETEKIYEE